MMKGAKGEAAGVDMEGGGIRDEGWNMDIGMGIGRVSVER